MTLFSEQEDNNKAKAEAEAKVNIAVLILKSFMGCWGLVYIKIRKNISTGILEPSSVSLPQASECCELDEPPWHGSGEPRQRGESILEYWNTGIPAFAPR